MFTCQFIFLLLLHPPAWATDYVVFADQTFSMAFEEPKVSDGQELIQVQIDNVLLTPTPTSGGWYVYRPDDSPNSTVYLKNDGIIPNKTSFTVSITFATLAQQIINFSVLNANITKDFVLPTAQEPESFALVCSYSVSEGETLQSMLWSKGGSADKPVAVENSTSRDNRVLVTSVENGTIQLSVSRIDPNRKYRHGVAEPLTAYSGVYHCLLNVQLTDGKVVKGSLSVVVSAKPIVNVYTLGYLVSSNVQFRSGDRVDLLCIADGYPLSSVSWVFSQRRKGQLPSTTDYAFDDIKGNNSKYDISNGTMGSLIGRSQSLLVIDDLDNVDDRGIYRCRATNILGSNHSSYYLRIRHRFAFAVPLAGIVFQLFLFLAIIKLVKPKKTKKEVITTETSGKKSKVSADRRAHADPAVNEDITVPVSKSLVKPGLVRSEMYKTHELEGRIEEETRTSGDKNQPSPLADL